MKPPSPDNPLSEDEAINGSHLALSVIKPYSPSPLPRKQREARDIAVRSKWEVSEELKQTINILCSQPGEP
ncbi:unnamed protein product [Arabidopsis lyrata]|nr:unnamed protein product [Arabidopsis lyrata]